MTDRCERTFDEELLSGYLDRELTQGDDQRVRLHLEDCAICRRLVEDLRTMREAAMTTPFPPAVDDQWDEAPRGLVSKLARNLGWTLLIAWALGAVALGVYALLTGPEGWVEKLVVFSLGLGIAGVFLSVLLDRLKSLKTDRYRRVQK